MFKIAQMGNIGTLKKARKSFESPLFQGSVKELGRLPAVQDDDGGLVGFCPFGSSVPRETHLGVTSISMLSRDLAFQKTHQKLWGNGWLKRVAQRSWSFTFGTNIPFPKSGQRADAEELRVPNTLPLSIP